MGYQAGKMRVVEHCYECKEAFIVQNDTEQEIYNMTGMCPDCRDKTQQLDEAEQLDEFDASVDQIIKQLVALKRVMRGII